VAYLSGAFALVFVLVAQPLLSLATTAAQSLH